MRQSWPVVNRHQGRRVGQENPAVLSGNRAKWPCLARLQGVIYPRLARHHAHPAWVPTRHNSRRGSSSMCDVPRSPALRRLIRRIATSRASVWPGYDRCRRLAHLSKMPVSILSLPSSKSTFSQPFREKCISDAVRVGVGFLRGYRRSLKLITL